MHSRPLTAADLDAVLDVRHAVERDDDLPLRTPRAEVAEELADPSVDLGADSVGRFDDGGSCAAYGWVRLYPAPAPQGRWAMVHGAVHPGRTGAGLGRELLAHLTARGEALLRTVPDPDPPRMLTAFVGEGQVAAMHLLRQAGFTAIRHMDDLSVDLAAVVGPHPARKPPEGIVITGWDPARSREAKGVHRGAFVDHWGSSPITERQWQHLLSAPHFQPGLSTVALRPSPDGDPEREALIGLVLASLWPEDWPVTGRQEAWIDVVAVARSSRGTGIAEAMLRRTLALAADQDLTHAGLSVDAANPSGAHRLYARMGFASTWRTQRWVRPLDFRASDA